MASALVILKPDAAHRLAVREALWAWLAEERGWKLSALTWYQPPKELIQRHYDFLEGRPFFPWLVDFMTALPTLVGRVEAAPAELEKMRYELGETRIHEARPGSLRERYGIFGGLNCVHLSDAAETGAAEVKRWSEHVQLDSIKVRFADSGRKPDHTFHLRSLATQVVAGLHTGSATQMMRQLLAEESDLEGDKLEALYRITLGALV